MTAPNTAAFQATRRAQSHVRSFDPDVTGDADSLLDGDGNPGGKVTPQVARAIRLEIERRNGRG